MLNRLFAQTPIELVQRIQMMGLAHLTKLVDSQNTLEDTMQCLQQIKNFIQNQPEPLADQSLNQILNLIARIMLFTAKETLLSFFYEADENSIPHLYSSNPSKILISMRKQDLVVFEQINSLQEKYATLKKMHSSSPENLAFMMRMANSSEDEETLLIDGVEETAILNFMEDLLDIIHTTYFPTLSPSPTRMRID